MYCEQAEMEYQRSSRQDLWSHSKHDYKPGLGVTPLTYTHIHVHIHIAMETWVSQEGGDKYHHNN